MKSTSRAPLLSQNTEAMQFVWTCASQSAQPWPQLSLHLPRDKYNCLRQLFNITLNTRNQWSAATKQVHWLYAQTIFTFWMAFVALLGETTVSLSQVGQQASAMLIPWYAAKELLGYILTLSVHDNENNEISMKIAHILRLTLSVKMDISSKTLPFRILLMTHWT